MPNPIIAATKEVTKPTIIDHPHPVVNNVPRAPDRINGVSTRPLSKVMIALTII